MKLPRWVKVCHRKYKIVEWTPTQALAVNRFGECSSVEAIIRVDLSHGLEKARDTLLHEILHAIYYEWGIQDEDKEERVVSTFAKGLTQAMADSQECRKWFQEAWSK